MLCGGMRLPEESGDSGFSAGLLYLTTCPGARVGSVMLISLGSIFQGAVFPHSFPSSVLGWVLSLGGVQPEPGAKGAVRGSAAFGLNSL